MSSPDQKSSFTSSKLDVEKQEDVEIVVDEKTNAAAIVELAPATAALEAKSAEGGKPTSGGPPGGHGGGHGGHGGGRGLPPNHPMHPSQFSGDRFERTPLLTLVGCFCVMFCSFGWINCEYIN